jgi:DNA-binding SARP family transcriptional activator
MNVEMQPVVITTLGEFSIAYGENNIAEKDKRSKKMWTLLKYLTAFIDKNVTQAELIEVLWGDEDIHNPTGALKTQLHRLRATLSVLGIPVKTELVLSFAGTYAFNDSIEYTVDAVQFEKNFKQSQRSDISEKEQILFAKKAFEMYGGAFLKNSGNEKWVVPIRVHYHSIYLRVVHRLTDALYKHKQYAELINVCRRALLLEAADQKTHMLLIRALIAQNDREAAKKHYKYVIDMLYNELGVNPLPELKELYREITDKDALFEDSLEIVQRKLREDSSETESGAFFCELEIFKNIYRLRIRDSKRNGHKVQICLISINDRSGVEIESKKMIKEMKRLHNCISVSLRKSDAFARYSLSQFVLMLPSAEGDAGEVVVNRIEKSYKKKNTGFLLDINFKHVIAT